MSTESMIRDLELAEEALKRKARGPLGLGRCLCLTLISSFLLAGATVLFCLLHFGVIGPQKEQESTDTFLDMKPLTQRVRSLQNESAKPVAHLIADQLAEGQLLWVGDVANTLLMNGMELVDNQLVLPSTGLYLVYSQLLYKGSQCGKESLVLTHKISRFTLSYQKKVTLLANIRSSCRKAAEDDGEPSAWYEPVYLAGVFQLTEGDKLVVDTNYPENLDFAEPGQLYFGAIAL
ncbi:tumor necrosis factor [Trichosurus vulpecula]|uniref:Tumor necrosis factor n=1 Tax=Trichosurus vulpecula TaxID=9337 RepID=TNFA_TRIVU|nr:tumor necrosis factor [Trichosurus vulpecula]P79374.1 RecName: Full=Tumor necrosis factor; AltName: Full=Cachectin; AltName: Full=TNF-alpha; AltName: Full=Tumor necrosis factor ligand superfamily member 2; Short=TNF-a; Contains: RecName: Full=Tumor necrosis factor, membrane form; AltName: Full=N-terminal fragment; Short=NTF; Contains: RecName: Full=Intracellular domain 1; Short=ICD1; Contains: RecName: Full=Intracellular domain 2; Short=ICD2; Contains: RecName: Full=C-domain 1; Contains: RecNam